MTEVDSSAIDATAIDASCRAVNAASDVYVEVRGSLAASGGVVSAVMDEGAHASAWGKDPFASETVTATASAQSPAIGNPGAAPPPPANTWPPPPLRDWPVAQLRYLGAVGATAPTGLLMAGPTQHHYLHALPMTTRDIGERINLTFRYVTFSY